MLPEEPVLSQLQSPHIQLAQDIVWSQTLVFGVALAQSTDHIGDCATQCGLQTIQRRWYVWPGRSGFELLHYRPVERTGEVARFGPPLNCRCPQNQADDQILQPFVVVRARL